MRRLLLSGLMVLAFSVTAFAGVDVSKLQLPGDITQAQADTVIKGALAKAKEQGVPMNIAVVDAGGNLKAFTRMDGAFLGSIDISIGKARTARLFNMPTSALGAASQAGNCTAVQSPTTGWSFSAAANCSRTRTASLSVPSA